MQWYFEIRVWGYLIWKAVWGKSWKIFMGSKAMWKAIACRRVLISCCPLETTKEEIDCQTSSQISWKTECLTYHGILCKRQNDPLLRTVRFKIIVNLPLSAHFFYSQGVQREVNTKLNMFLSKRERHRWSLFFSTWCCWNTMCHTLRRLFLVPNVFLLIK